MQYRSERKYNTAFVKFPKDPKRNNIKHNITHRTEKSRNETILVSLLKVLTYLFKKIEN